MDAHHYLRFKQIANAVVTKGTACTPKSVWQLEREVSYCIRRWTSRNGGAWKKETESAQPRPGERRPADRPKYSPFFMFCPKAVPVSIVIAQEPVVQQSG